MSEPKQRGPVRRLMRLAVTVGLNAALVLQVMFMCISRAHVFWQATGSLGILFFGWVDAAGIWIVADFEQAPWSNRDFVPSPEPTVDWDDFYVEARKGSIGDSWACWTDEAGLHLVSRHASTLIVILILQALHHRRVIANLVRCRRGRDEL